MHSSLISLHTPDVIQQASPIKPPALPAVLVSALHTDMMPGKVAATALLALLSAATAASSGACCKEKKVTWKIIKPQKFVGLSS